MVVNYRHQRYVFTAPESIGFPLFLAFLGASLRFSTHSCAVLVFKEFDLESISLDTALPIGDLIREKRNESLDSLTVPCIPTIALANSVCIIAFVYDLRTHEMQKYSQLFPRNLTIGKLFPIQKGWFGTERSDPSHFWAMQLNTDQSIRKLLDTQITLEDVSNPIRLECVQPHEREVVPGKSRLGRLKFVESEEILFKFVAGNGNANRSPTRDKGWSFEILDGRQATRGR
jgi:hypothetical protein